MIEQEHLMALGPHAMRLPWRFRWAIYLLLIIGLVTSGFLIANHTAQQSSDRSSQAQTNVLRCQSTLNANWREAFSVLGVALTSRGPTIDASIATGLDLPRDRDAVISLGQRRIVAALADDSRLNTDADRICPFTPGDPSKTPDTPVNSATAALEYKLAHGG